MTDLDLNLLRVVVALDEKRSVSGAALALHRSQPSMSVALGKLRAFFNDPLFIRSGNHMHPTPRAVALVESARMVLDRVGADIVSTTRFDPAVTQVINLALSDVGEVVFLPAILEELQRVARNTRVRSVSLPANEVANGLENGAID